MNILYLQSTPDLYGASRMLLRTATRQIEDGKYVAVILFEDGPLKAELENVGVHVEIVQLDPCLRKRNIKRPFCFLRDCWRSVLEFKRIAKELHVDIIASNTSQIVTGGIAARWLKIPHICHVRESYHELGHLWRLYRRFLLCFSDKIVCVSDAMAVQFPESERGSKVVTVHDGFPKSEFEPVDPERIRRFKTQFNLNGYLLVGLVGRIILQRKGQDVFAKAIARLKNSYENVKFLIIGSCYPGNEFHSDNLSRLIKKLDLADAIVQTGEVADIKAAYSALDISVMASATPEPFGGVSIESMAFGKPVVGTNIGGTPEQIVDGETGILIPPNDPEEMANAIARLLEDEDLRLKMGRVGKDRFEEYFTFAPYFRRFNDVYRELM